MVYQFRVRDILTKKQLAKRRADGFDYYETIDIEATSCDHAWGLFNQEYAEVWDIVELLNGYQGDSIKVPQYASTGQGRKVLDE